MHARFLTAASGVAVIAAGTLAVPTMAHADTADHRPKTAQTVEEHGVAIPSGRGITPRYTETPEGGGTWTYGTNGPNNTVFSNFYHAKRKHGSSAENGAGNLDRSKDTAAGATSTASIRKTFAGNHAYYRFVK